MSKCKCVEAVNEELAKHNTRLCEFISLSKGATYIQIASEKIDTKKRGNAKQVLASFCPFCGKPGGE